MARKSRKHQYTEMFRPSTANAVGYVSTFSCKSGRIQLYPKSEIHYPNAGAISTKFLYRITISIMVLAVSDLTGLHFKK